MEIRVKYVVVFQQDGLDMDGLKPDLEKYGTITEIEYRDEDGLGPIAMVYIDSDFGKFNRFKWDYNCVSAEDNSYVLFPMASMEDKIKVLRSRGA